MFGNFGILGFRHFFRFPSKSMKKQATKIPTRTGIVTGYVVACVLDSMKLQKGTYGRIFIRVPRLSGSATPAMALLGLVGACTCVIFRLTWHPAQSEQAALVP